MSRKLLSLSLVLVVVFALSGVVAGNELVFSDSFESDKLGGAPAGWTLIHPEAGVVVDSSTVLIPHGGLALQLNNTSDLNGEVQYDISAINKGKLVVDFYQPSSSRENINIEIRNEDQRIVGVFITGSGNIRPRDKGVQTPDLMRLSNDQWHTFVITWDIDKQRFDVAYMLNGQEIAITGPEGAGIDPAGTGLPANRILFNVSRRDLPKEAYIDNVRVYNLAP